MYKFKHDMVNNLTDEERFDLITDGCLREPIYDFGTELLDDKDIKYECEYLTEKKSIKKARMLWCINTKTKTFVKLPEDPALEGYDDSNRSEHYLEIKARIAKGDCPELWEIESQEEFQLILHKLIESGIVQFNRETGEHTIPEPLKSELDRWSKRALQDMKKD